MKAYQLQKDVSMESIARPREGRGFDCTCHELERLGDLGAEGAIIRNFDLNHICELIGLIERVSNEQPGWWCRTEASMGVKG